MQLSKKQIWASVLIFLIVPGVVCAQVIINEVAWMGTATSDDDEWIELRNTSASNVNLNGWTLTATDGVPSIGLNGSLSGGGFFLLERTDDTTLPTVLADQIYVGALENAGELLILKNAGGEAVSTVDGSGGWPAGDKDSNQTMQWNGSTWTSGIATPKLKTVGSSELVVTPTAITTASNSMVNDFTPSQVVGETRVRPFASLSVRGATSVRENVPEYYYVEIENKLGNPDIIWSFGDGQTVMGAGIWHTFLRQGQYIVAVRAPSLGPQAIAKQSINVYRPTIKIENAEPGWGGAVSITNHGKSEIDLGGYSVRLNGSSFTFPTDTYILPGATTDFSASVTKISFTEGQIELLAPDGKIIDIFPPIEILPKQKDKIIEPVVSVVAVPSFSQAVPEVEKVTQKSNVVIIERKNNMLAQILAFPRLLLASIYEIF